MSIKIWVKYLTQGIVHGSVWKPLWWSTCWHFFNVQKNVKEKQKYVRRYKVIKWSLKMSHYYEFKIISTAKSTSIIILFALWASRLLLMCFSLYFAFPLSIPSHYKGVIDIGNWSITAQSERRLFWY